MLETHVAKQPNKGTKCQVYINSPFANNFPVDAFLIALRVCQTIFS